MKQKNLLTRMLLLFALVVGSVTSVWAEDKTITITRDSFTDAESGYGTYSWTADGVSGKGQIYGTTTNSMQMNGGNANGKIIYNTTALSGKLKKINLTKSSGSNRSYSVYGRTTAYSGTGDYGTLIATANIQDGNGRDYTVTNGEYSFFVIVNATSNAAYLASIVVTYEEESGTTTTTTIDDSGITNKDVYNGTAAGSLSATVTAGGNAISGATVTWSSSNTGVATIASDGAVTLVAAGTTTITASYAGVEDVYQPSSATYEMTVTNSDPNAPGTENNPYTVAQAIAATPSSGNVYIKGIVSSFFNTSIVGDGSNYRYYISDDGTEEKQLLVYKGKGLNNVAFSNADDLRVGDVVVICGKLITYNNASEVDADNYIVSLVRPKHNVTFLINGVVGKAVEVEQGDAIEFPADPDAIEGKTFVGWTAEAIDGTTDTAPTFVTSATMGTTDVIYYAVFATGSVSTQPANITITANTPGVPTSYGTANTFNEYELEGINFMIMQMYKSGGKLQWRAAGNSSGTGTMYNKDALNQIQSIVLTYNSSDSNKNFTVKVGDSKNPVDGTSVTPAENGSVYTFDCSSSDASYFVLTNGDYAGYLDKIEINYLKESEDFSGYCTTVIPTGVTVTIASSGYTTLSSTYGLDFANSTAEGADALIAYIIPSNNGVKLTKTEVTEAAAGTGILLKGTPGATYSIPVKADAAEVVTNLLKAGPKVVEEGNKTIYLLKSGEFRLASAGTTSVGKAYLELLEAVGAPALSIDGDGDTTGIQNIERTINDNQYYTLDGRRVAQPTKGLYIVNGRKVIVK